LLQKCRRQLNSLFPAKASDSKWTGYLGHKSLYSPPQLEEKDAFVQEALDTTCYGSHQVLDVGANQGRFSLMAARSRPSVVAIDSDPAVIGSLWRKAVADRLEILPLVVDITRPSPSIGWRNQECASFLDRARGQFDLVMMLAVVHHMIVTERIP